MKFTLGEHANIPIHIHEGIVQSAEFTVEYYNRNSRLEDYGPRETVDLEITSGSLASVPFTPSQSGRQRIYLTVTFSDSTFVKKEIDVIVEMPKTPALAFFLTKSGVDHTRTDWIELHSTGASTMQRIVPYGQFKEGSDFLPVPKGDVHFEMFDDSHGPYIALDRDSGVVKALRPGKALIKASYEGKVDTVCVEVRSSSLGFPVPNCSGIAPK